MTASSMPSALQPDALSPPVVTRLAKLPNKDVSRWPVTVESLQRQALMVLEDGIAIVCDNLTYRTTEPDAFSKVTFTDDTHASIRLPLRTVGVEFANAADGQQFRAAVTARTTTVSAAEQDAGVPFGQSGAEKFGKPANMVSRLFARMVDGILVSVGLAVALTAVNLVFAPSGFSLVLGLLLLIAGYWGYPAYFIGVKGQTPGKQMFGVRIIDADTLVGPIGPGRAVAREIVLGLSGIPLMIGYFSPFFDNTGRLQGWHDKASNALVVRESG